MSNKEVPDKTPGIKKPLAYTDKKFRKCLKCGNLFKTTIGIRICGGCSLQNSKFRSKYTMGFLIPQEKPKPSRGV